MILLRPNPAQNAAANFISVLMVSGLYITGTYFTDACFSHLKQSLHVRDFHRFHEGKVANLFKVLNWLYCWNGFLFL